MLLWRNFHICFFSVDLKNTYRGVVSQNFSTVSQIFSQLYQNEIWSYTAAIKICHIKGKWEQKILSSYLKETSKPYIKEVFHRIFTSALILEICWFELLSWIFVDMHDTSQVRSRNFIFLGDDDYTAKNVTSLLQIVDFIDPVTTC